MGHISLLQGHFWIQGKKIHDFFVTNFFYGEVKKLSSWKFFDWNRFGNRISTPKCNHSNF